MLFRVASALALLSAIGSGGPSIYETLSPARTGISFVHNNAKSFRRYLPESMGPGVAIFDYDSDGDMDLYFTNSGPSDFFAPKKPLRNALYRNNGDTTFTDVTLEAGVPGRDFGIGVTTCDYNKDGKPDLFLTNYGVNVLYSNNGDGTFSDVTRAAGLEAKGLWTAAVFFDYDNNGTEDLFVGHFVKYSRQLERDCAQNGVPHYCYPLTYDPWPSSLYRNNGNGTFSDISDLSGISKARGKTFGAVATDINADGLLDLFVANDSVPNFLFLNKGSGKFDEIGLEAGVAYNLDGAARSGMGVAATDYDNDGKQDLFVSNFNRERFSLYRNRGDRTFADDAGLTGIGAATQMYSGWGVKFFDFDRDGDEDLVVCNGHPDDLIETLSSTLTYREPILLFEQSDGKFINLGPRAGQAFTETFPARGLAVGDLDNDGLPDIVIASNGEAPLILRHSGSGAQSGWVGLRFIGHASGVHISWTVAGKRRSRLKIAGGSYLSASDPREILGLNSAARIDLLEIRWPDGAIRQYRNVMAGRYYTVDREGKLR